MNQEPVTIDSAVVYFTPTKESIQAMINSLTEAVAEGKIDALQGLVKLRAAQQVIEGAIENIERFTVDEASKYGRGEEIKVLGAELKLKEAGVKYDFTNCGDTVWQSFKVQETAIAEQRKLREKFLQSIQGSQTLVNEDTGEIYTVHPPKKSSKTIVEVRIK